MSLRLTFVSRVSISEAMGRAGRGKRAGKQAKTLAERADRHRLYEAAVQDTESEVRFVSRTFSKLRGRKALTLREGFSGTSKLCLTWVQSDRQRRAWGIDLDGPTLDWGRVNHLEPAEADCAARVELVETNVLAHVKPKVDIALGFNFSYFCFKSREQLRKYFVAAFSGLNEDGVLFLDCYGGTEVPKADEEAREVELDNGSTVTYRWVHDSFNPINHDLQAHIAFDFDDGSTLDPAFHYDWRHWSLPEIRELLMEAGFTKVHVYWEIEDDQGEGTGRFRDATDGENEGIWWVFIAAEREPKP